MPDSVEQAFRQYFVELDASIEKLSHKMEGSITRLPSWVLVHRRITIGKLAEGSVWTYSVVPDSDLTEDVVIVNEHMTEAESAELLRPVVVDVTKHRLHGIQFGDAVLAAAGKPNTRSRVVIAGLRGICPHAAIPSTFSTDLARRHALDFWNLAANDIGGSGSFVDAADAVFWRLSSLLHRKSFLERRVHRYIREHSSLLLPSFKKCHSEYALFRGTDKQVADFVLEREYIQPALLIELESPRSKLYRKNGELTAEANHAREQIGRWVRFIDEEPANSEGEMGFLKGTKERLIIMGRGLDRLDEMRASIYADTRIWTYDVLLSEAKDHWTAILAEQCRYLGIPSPPRFS